MTDTIPDHTTYVASSLAGSAGAWGYHDRLITWTGTVSSGSPITLTFRVVVDETLVGPYALTNRAVLNDQVGVTRTIQATTLIDPLRRYLPVVWVASQP
jgi:hypothetical protein